MSNERIDQEQQAWIWIKANMPDEVQKALDKFLSLNPQMRGVDWWDVLSMLRDSDSHLDITEPMFEAMDEWDILRSFVTLTLLYASKSFAVDYTDEMRVHAVRATILNNRHTEVTG